MQTHDPLNIIDSDLMQQQAREMCDDRFCLFFAPHLHISERHTWFKAARDELTFFLSFQTYEYISTSSFAELVYYFASALALQTIFVKAEKFKSLFILHSLNLLSYLFTQLPNNLSILAVLTNHICVNNLTLLISLYTHLSISLCMRRPCKQYQWKRRSSRAWMILSRPRRSTSWSPTSRAILSRQVGSLNHCCFFTNDLLHVYL